MDTEKWKVLLRAIDTGSLSSAAEQLDYTPSGVSRMMAALEAEVGFSLLTRGRSGVEPTRECASLLPTVREAVHLGALLRQQTDRINGLETGSLSVGSAYTAYFPWLTRLIASFTRLYPGITVHLLHETSSRLLQAMQERRADLCIISRREGDMTWFPLRQDRLMALVSLDHPLAGADAFPLSAFATEPFIQIYPGQETDNSRLFARCGITPNIRFTTLDTYAAHAMVEAGLGVTLSNDIIAREWTGRIRALPLDPPQTVDIGLAGLPVPSPAARRFLSFIVDTHENR